MLFWLRLLLPLAALSVALVLTPVVRKLARRWHIVAEPKADRWHKQPTALWGGLAIAAAFALPALMLLPDIPQLPVILIGSLLMVLVGLVDDLWELKPYQKLIWQIFAASLVIASELWLPWTPWPLVNMALTLLWLVGITNAVNLLDNMDGLAAGVSGIAAACLSINFFLNEQMPEAVLMASLTAALLAFLVYNTHPASIFMGDCGALFLGFVLASAAMLSASGGRSRSFMAVLAVPVLTLLIPILDTTFVSVARKISGRGITQGFPDHTSHRLVALGLSEPHVVYLLYGFAAVSGALALATRQLEPDVSLMLLLGVTLVCAFLGTYLAGVRVYSETELATARVQPLVGFLVDLSYKRRVFEVLLDVLLVATSYYAAYVFRYGSLSRTGDWELYLRLLPLAIPLKLGAFLLMGVYRGLWRYVGVEDLVVYAKAVGIGSAATALAILMVFRFEGFSRGVLLADALVLFVLLSGSRLTFRVFRSVLPVRPSAAARRVLIYGAGDAGELLLRELRANPRLECVPVGFLDDDPHKRGKLIRGLRVFGGHERLSAVCRDFQVDEVLISTAHLPTERVRQLHRQCCLAGVLLKRMRFEVELVDPALERSLLEAYSHGLSREHAVG